MRRIPLVWLLFPSYVLIILLTLGSVTLYTTHALNEFNREQTSSDLEAKAKLVEQYLRHVDIENDGLGAEVKRLGSSTVTRIRVYDRNGVVVADSRNTQAPQRAEPMPPEVRAALQGDIGRDIRNEAATGGETMYVAAPVWSAGKPAGAVRTSLPTTLIDEALGELYQGISLGGVVIAALAAAVSLVISRRLSRPLRDIRRGAERFAQGELDHRVAGGESAEIRAVATALNDMATQLEGRIDTVIQQRNELDAVLSSMAEAVFAVDAEACLVSMNTAASHLFGVDPERSTGRHLTEVVRNTELLEFVKGALASSKPQRGEIAVYRETEHIFQAHGAVLRSAGDTPIGAVVVLNDITNLRRLERVRRDFVANVSHEIRTPVTSIKGYVETLLDGAYEDKDDLLRFLEIILRQSDRLNMIIEDLLTLARLEQESEEPAIPLEEGSVLNVLGASVQACEARSAAKGIHVDLECAAELRARLNPPLLEQAVVNLIDNAVKYSEPGSEVHVRAARSNGALAIEVADNGAGIEAAHLPRLFERFYRVDKARSRRLGGTGLGLAIVKHIAQAHGGGVTVKSRPGQGSVFTISLPAQPTPQEPA